MVGWLDVGRASVGGKGSGTDTDPLEGVVVDRHCAGRTGKGREEGGGGRRTEAGSHVTILWGVSSVVGDGLSRVGV